ncbi:MAG: bifunctional phosphoribosylaminoimidazolecarboxamide formyltransferase/IMP cyclohydrolase [Phycisphaerae bacterium]
MANVEIKRALIAVYDKTGVAEFARSLVEEFGVEIISTGGTARHLQAAGIPVTLVEQITGFPEMLNGRVKTLHPKIHAAILADRDNPEHMRQLVEQGIEPIDMVVVNLYPFEETIKRPDCTFDEAIEMIDIGGPCLLRAAAKNHRHVVVVSEAHTRELVLTELGDDGIVSESTRVALATLAFRVTGGYDETVELHLMERTGEYIHDLLGEAHALRCREDPDAAGFELPAMEHVDSLRYGENPHQRGELFAEWRDEEGFEDDGRSASKAALLSPVSAPGTTPMSFNNYVDADAALALCAELSGARMAARSTGAPRGLKPAAPAPLAQAAEPRACCVFVKHTNACGVGAVMSIEESAKTVSAARVEAYRRAYLGDPNAAMGGILAVSFEVDAGFAEVVMASLQRWGKAVGAGAFFVEVFLAPAFQEKAVDVIRNAKKWGQRVRLLTIDEMTATPDDNEIDFKRIAGGMLVQSRNLVGLNEEQWKTVTKRAPSDREMADLRLAWLVCKHTKSNAISICRDGMLIGNGAGQMSRVMSCRIATWLAKENGHEDKLKGAAAASDAFFPFRDGPDLLADAGVTAIIQPGGSKRDAETIAACDERGVAMIFTGTRHFKH